MSSPSSHSSCNISSHRGSSDKTLFLDTFSFAVQSPFLFTLRKKKTEKKTHYYALGPSLFLGSLPPNP